jgi:hypothetical protein
MLQLINDQLLSMVRFALFESRTATNYFLMISASSCQLGIFCKGMQDSMRDAVVQDGVRDTAVQDSVRDAVV